MSIIKSDNVEFMKTLAAESAQLICTDLDFGIGKISRKTWKGQDPLLFPELIRVLDPKGVLVLFASGTFVFELYNILEKYYKYMIVWDKGRTTGHLNASKMPMLCHEMLLVFSKAKMGKHTYNPQMSHGIEPHSAGKAHGQQYAGDSIYNRHRIITRNTNMKFPRTVIRIPAVTPSIKEYPTEKPLALFEYIVKTYSNEGDLVIDPACGSGHCLVAAKKFNRKFIGVDKSDLAIKLSKRNTQQVL